MKVFLHRGCIVALFLLALGSARAQGTFQNLDFEEAVLVPIPGDLDQRVEWADAVPRWTGYLGTNVQGAVLHNGIYMSYPSIGIMGPDAVPMQGNFWLLLGNPLGAEDVPSISQKGSLPSNAQSIRFWTSHQYAIGFTVSFRGERINLTRLGPTSTGAWMWGGDISDYSGTEGNLVFFGVGALDNIVFSPEPIPEPGVGLLVLLGGGLWLTGRDWRKRERKEEG